MVRSLRITHIYVRLRSVALPSHFLHFLLNQFHALQVNFDFLGVMLYTAPSVHTINHKMKVRESHCMYQWNAITTKDDDRGVTKLHHCQNVRV